MFGNFLGRGKQLPPPPPEEPGLVPGCKLGELLGRGRLGEVYAAVHLKAQRNVACKLLRADLAQETIAQMRFRRQTQVQLKLKHANLVKVFELGEATDGRAYLLMERVVGETLQGKAPLPAAKVAQIIAAAAAALQAMHKDRHLHLDVKTENFFCCEDGGFRLMGLSFCRGDMNAPTVTTSANVVAGTPAYMAPEQAKGEPNARSDQYSLGVVACELLTGSLPVEGRCPPLTPEAATAVVQRMLSPQFEKRFPSPEEAAKALTEALSGKNRCDRMD